MGRALAEQLKADYAIWAFDQDASKTKSVEGINAAQDSKELLSRADVVLLAVKPQDFDSVLGQIRGSTDSKLLISIAAGIPTTYIERNLGKARVVRVMPNMPAKIGRGMSCLCRGSLARSRDLELAEELFQRVGKTLILDEAMMDAATAVSGSGPGYVYDFIESLSMDYKDASCAKLKSFVSAFKEAALSLGFEESQAELLVETTVAGSLAMLEAQKLSPSELKRQIVSKGGTTEAALKVLHQGGSLIEAVGAALERGRELSRKE